MRFLGLFLMACAGGKADDDTARVPVVEVDWGSWQLDSSFETESDTCAGLGASGESLGTLYGEIEVGHPNEISMLLGDLLMEGTRSADMFEIEGFSPIDTGDDTDAYGIGASITGSPSDSHNFTGTLVYALDFPADYCEIYADIVAEWLYYEPPPPCGG